MHAKNFRLQLSKCRFRKSEVPFLGHIANELRLSLNKVEAIAGAPPPTNLQQLVSFFGLVTYCSDFLADLAMMAEPLRVLHRKGAAFIWSEECQEAFQKIKDRIGDNLKLALYDPNAETFLNTDASGVGILAVLSQKQEGKEVVIACKSHTLQPAARNYSMLEQEAYAIVWWMESFEKFLWGRPFIIRMDHRALQFLFQGPAKVECTRRSSKLIRWAERLSTFDYRVEHVKGTSNQFADAISHLPLQNTESALPELTKDVTLKRIAVEGMTLDKLQNATKDDPVLQQVIPLVNGHWPAKAQIPPNLLAYHNVCGDLLVGDGCPQILQQAHLGHPGVTRMKHLLCESYWWPLMSVQIEELVAHCSGCQFSEKSSPPADIVKIVVPCPEVCWMKIGVDIAGPFADAPQNQHYIVTAIDYTCKYPECLLMLDIHSLKLIDWLEDLFARYGNPDQLVSDNGPQFVSAEFTNFLKSHGIEHVHTAVYNPSENSLVEVFNHVLKYGVQCFQSTHFPGTAY